MTNLATKFSGFESQIGTNHTEIMTALNALIEGIGGVPTTPSVTLADVVTALNTINSNIVQMRSANALYYASALNALDSINTNTDTIINNNSLNAQRIIQAIYATFCDCTTTNPLLPPPISVTPTPLTVDEKCRRVQFYLAVFTTWLNSIANYGSTGASITGGVLETLLAGAAAAFGLTATGAEVGAAAGIPGAIAGAIVGAIVAAVYTFGGSVLIDYANQFASPVVQDDLRQALYDANSADEGQAAFYATTGEHFSAIPSGIINFLWWSAWSNDLYSATPVVDDSGFDSTICAPPGPTTVLTESCGVLFDGIFAGDYDSGNRNIASYTHLKIGASNGVGGSVTLYVDGVAVLTVSTTPPTNTGTWIGTGTNAKTVIDAPGNTYVVLEACTGTYA